MRISKFFSSVAITLAACCSLAPGAHALSMGIIGFTMPSAQDAYLTLGSGSLHTGTGQTTSALPVTFWYTVDGTTPGSGPLDANLTLTADLGTPYAATGATGTETVVPLNNLLVSIASATDGKNLLSVEGSGSLHLDDLMVTLLADDTQAPLTYTSDYLWFQPNGGQVGLNLFANENATPTSLAASPLTFGFNMGSFVASATPTPEPSSLVLGLGSLMGLTPLGLKRLKARRA